MISKSTVGTQVVEEYGQADLPMRLPEVMQEIEEVFCPDGMIEDGPIRNANLGADGHDDGPVWNEGFLLLDLDVQVHLRPVPALVGVLREHDFVCVQHDASFLVRCLNLLKDHCLGGWISLLGDRSRLLDE